MLWSEGSGVPSTLRGQQHQLHRKPLSRADRPAVVKLLDLLIRPRVESGAILLHSLGQRPGIGADHSKAHAFIPNPPHQLSKPVQGMRPVHHLAEDRRTFGIGNGHHRRISQVLAHLLNDSARFLARFVVHAAQPVDAPIITADQVGNRTGDDPISPRLHFRCRLPTHAGLIFDPPVFGEGLGPKIVGRVSGATIANPERPVPVAVLAHILGIAPYHCARSIRS